jgi:hypothetical protein
MIRTKTLAGGSPTNREVRPDGSDQLLLIDDAVFVSAFAEAHSRLGSNPVCVRCFDPTRALRAVVLLFDAQKGVDETRGGLGLCHQCYKDLSELMFHDAVLRASRPTSD